MTFASLTRGLRAAAGRIDAFALTVVLFAAVAAGLAGYKVRAFGYTVQDLLPRTRYDVSLVTSFDGHGDDVRVRTFLPASDARQTIGDENNTSPGLRFTTEAVGLNREAQWSGQSVGGEGTAAYRFSVMSHAMRFDIDPQLQVPPSYEPSVTPFLRAEEDVQVDAPEIRRLLGEIGADHGTVLARLQRIHDRVSGIPQRPFKGTTDALTTLRLGEASCNGKSRLFVALARAAGIPARLVGGFVMKAGSSRTTHQWVEANVAEHWVPFDPTNHHFASVPAHYLVLYYGDEALFRRSKEINFRYRYDVDKTLVPSDRAKTALGRFNVWALFERLGLPASLLRTVLMLPIGALVVVLFRNVIGMPTFGTFLPALIAAAAGETGVGWGLVGLLLVVLAATLARLLMKRLDLLHSPTLAILLTVVAVSMLLTTLVAEQLGYDRLTRISLFPIAVLAITSERFYLSLSEQGPLSAAKEFAGTCTVILACYLTMNSLALQLVVIGFPEVLLVVVALDLYLGRWVGMRLSEYLRFRHVLRDELPRGGPPGPRPAAVAS